MIARKRLILPVVAIVVVAAAAWGSLSWRGPQPAQAAMEEAAAVVEPGEGGTGAEQPAPASLLEELALRLLTPPSRPPGGETPSVTLLPGQLPPDLPLTIRAPQGGRLVGSVVRTPGGKFGPTEIVLDAPGRAADAFAFYRKELLAQGWTENTSLHSPAWSRAGFQSDSIPTNGMFCQSPSEPWINLNVYTRSSAPADVRFHLQTAYPGPCGGPMPGPRPQEMPEAANHMPPLQGGEGMQLQVVMNGPQGPSRWVSEAGAEAPMKVTELESHFAEQLLAAGWIRRASDAAGPLAWSVWDIPGTGGWQGFFYALEAPGKGRRTLYVRVESADPVPGPMGLKGN